jgi:hypothetical protein
MLLKLPASSGKTRGYEGKIGEQVRGFGHFRWL